MLGLLTRRRREVELSEEIQSHLDLLANEHVRRGMPLREARAAARRDFGGVEQTKEAFRDQGARTTTLVLGGVVLFVLLLARANVANLILARGVGRTREIAVRAAIGVTPARIARQLLTEGTLLGGLGGATGLAVSWGLLHVAPSFIPPADDPRIDRARHRLAPRLAGAPAQDPANRPSAHYQMITPPYFDALGIPLARGRAFTSRDTSTTPPVAIVNEAFAQRYFPGRDPIGARITVESMAIQPTPVIREIVGVIRQVKTRPDEPSDNALEIYVPLAQNTWAITTVVIRAAGDPMRLMPSIRAAVARVDPLQIVSRVRTMDAVAAESTARPRFRAQLVTAFAALASVLAAVGIFSVFTFTVRQRTREFSIRMALSARSADVLRLVLGNAVKVVAVDLAVGVVAALGLVRSMATLLSASSHLIPSRSSVPPHCSDRSRSSPAPCPRSAPPDPIRRSRYDRSRKNLVIDWPIEL